MSGVKSKVESLCSKFEKDPDSVNLDDEHPNVISNVLKLYLRQVKKLFFIELLCYFEIDWWLCENNGFFLLFSCLNLFLALRCIPVLYKLQRYEHFVFNSSLNSIHVPNFDYQFLDVILMQDNMGNVLNEEDTVNKLGDLASQLPYSNFKTCAMLIHHLSR